MKRQSTYLKKLQMLCMLITAAVLFAVSVSAQIPEPVGNELHPGTPADRYTEPDRNAPSGADAIENQFRSAADDIKDAVSDAVDALPDGQNGVISEDAAENGIVSETADSANSADRTPESAESRVPWGILLILILAAAAVVIYLILPKRSR